MAAASTRLLARGTKKDRMFHPDWRWRAELSGPEEYREDNREIKETRGWVCVSGLPLPISISDAGAISVQFSSVAQWCLTLCDPMNRSMPGLPVHHQLPEFTQTHVHRVSDAIQPSHPLLFPSPPAPNPSQHQGLFQ